MIAVCDPPYAISIVKGSAVGGAKPFGKVGVGKPHAFAGNKRGRVHGPARNAIIQPGVYEPVIGDDTTDTAIAVKTFFLFVAALINPDRCHGVEQQVRRGRLVRYVTDFDLHVDRVFGGLRAHFQRRVVDNGNVGRLGRCNLPFHTTVAAMPTPVTCRSPGSV
jgi:hypothetical protein